MNEILYVHVKVDFDDRVIFLLETIARGILKMNASVDSLALEITTLQADVSSQTTVITSAETAFAGLAAQLAAALAAAAANGATPDQLSALSALHTQLVANTSGLAASVAANTVAAPQASAAVKA